MGNPDLRPTPKNVSGTPIAFIVREMLQRKDLTSPGGHATLRSHFLFITAQCFAMRSFISL
jgi:hypothetical protein